jgi:two-component system, NtrC family, sensor histidine kinase PilS
VISKESTSSTRVQLEGSGRWPWSIGLVRIGMLVVLAVGTLFLRDPKPIGLAWLALFYALGFTTSIYYFARLRREAAPSPIFTWAQLLVDFGVVAAAVNFTGGATSVLTFLFAVVILEAGLLLGQSQGFAFATLATGLLLVQVFIAPAPSVSSGGLSLWYSFLIQCLAYYLTAAVTGYWTGRLHRIQQFQREILDNMNSGFLITNTHGLVTAQNRAADRILGMKRSEGVGRPVETVLRVESGEECPILTALRSKRDFTSYEFHAQTDDGESKLLGLTTSPIYDAQHHLGGIIASFSDLTEMAKMREELQRQDRLAIVGELAAGLAHEIRNPVAAIRGAVDELSNNMDTPLLAEKLTEIAIRESDHLNRIVSDFLDFARRPSMRRENYDMRGLAEEVADSMRAKYCDSPDLTVRVESPTEFCDVSGDRSQLKQVFVNMAKNGIEAMEQNGALVITVTPGSGWVDIRFDDNGPGIPPDVTAHIFEPFYTTKASGVGMGLAVCMRIVTAHDGTIHAASRDSGGASLTVRLPVARQEE